jgi:mannose-6-phosphate isomerase-like protein (cupin superfamily)
MQHIEYIKDKEQILAIVISHRFNEKGIHFFTPNEFSQQLAYMNHPKGKIIQPHYHNPVERNVVFTQEVLVIKKGKLKVDFYDDTQIHLQSILIEEGDIILLASGGHGFEVIEDLEMIEVKQGPYKGDEDKTRFIAPKKD